MGDTITRARVRRDCRCPRVHHDHGTEAAYSTDGCRCMPCALARSAYTAARAAGAPVEKQTAPVHGTRRRLQALTMLGWSPTELAPMVGLDSQTVQRLREIGDHRTVLHATRDAVARVYDQVWATPSSGPHALRMRNMGLRKRWALPAEWDDDNIDDPAATPHRPRTGPVDLQPCGTAAAARRHYRRGEDLDPACRAAMLRQRAERREVAA